MRIGRPGRPLGEELEASLRRHLGALPDVAFAHLPEVLVPGRQDEPQLVLFVWLGAGALRSLRAALNQVCDVVARVLPGGQYLDVVILNSAPELLAAVEAADCLLLERDPEERRRALACLAESAGDD